MIVKAKEFLSKFSFISDAVKQQVLAVSAMNKKTDDLQKGDISDSDMASALAKRSEK